LHVARIASLAVSLESGDFSVIVMGSGNIAKLVGHIPPMMY
jgi:hypothetical protein